MFLVGCVGICERGRVVYVVLWCYRVYKSEVWCEVGFWLVCGRERELYVSIICFNDGCLLLGEVWVYELFVVVGFGQFYFVIQVLVLVEFGGGVDVVVEFVVWVDVVFFGVVFVVGYYVVFYVWVECGVYVDFG